MTFPLVFLIGLEQLDRVTRRVHEPTFGRTRGMFHSRPNDRKVMSCLQNVLVPFLVSELDGESVRLAYLVCLLNVQSSGQTATRCKKIYIC